MTVVIITPQEEEEEHQEGQRSEWRLLYIKIWSQCSIVYGFTKLGALNRAVGVILYSPRIGYISWWNEKEKKGDKTIVMGRW